MDGRESGAMKAYVHSIHSQVPDTISRLNEDFDLVVSMDSHLDLTFGMDREVYPKELRDVSGRTAAHTYLRRLTGDLPMLVSEEESDFAADFIIVISEGMFAKHAYDTYGAIEHAKRGFLEGKNPVAEYLDFIKKVFGIDIYLSPPQTLMNLAAEVRRYDSVLLDIDYDYVYEAQGECYTSISNAEPGVLQSLVHLLRFIEKTQPSTITISEAKFKAIKDPKSRFSALLAKLKRLGYDVEFVNLLNDDVQTLRRIKDTEDYYRQISKQLATQRIGHGEIDAVVTEESKMVAKAFFEARGYHF